MKMKNQQGKVVPCTQWDQKKGEQPGFRYSGEDGIESWNYPCFTYDPLNRDSKKLAMQKALETGQDHVEDLEQEVREEMTKARKKKEFAKTVSGDDEYEE